MIDNTSYEFRLLSLEVGQNLVQLFDAWKKEHNNPNIVVESPKEEKSKADILREYAELLKDGLIICEYEYDSFKEYNNLEIIKDKKYGYKNIRIYRYYE